MVEYVSAFREDLDTAEPALRNIRDTAAAMPRAPGKWSAKQVIGHLIDSASVNHERFLRAAQSEDLVFPGYDQDAWVAVQKYHERPWTCLVDLWLAYNTHLLHVMASMPDEHRRRSRQHHSLDVIAFRTVSANRPVTLDDLMSDYVIHVEHHLTQVLGVGTWSKRSGGTIVPPNTHAND